ncbi:MAG TPA: hypothetical protein VGV87_06025 [Blastocatellia bacterium]|jgi:hypothetical protein|nr:hypothetical protein [Blastocatellia bacterium]
MTKHSSKLRLMLSLAFVFAAIAIIAPRARAGGPLLVANGQPTRWPRTLVQGGPLNLKTVDESGRVLYRVDSGPLGPLSNTRAVGLVDRIFREYSEIPTASIDFVNAGSILDPDTGAPLDVDGTNFGKISKSRSFQNAIIFDSDGAITGGGGVLGFFTFIQLDQPTNTLREGLVVLNGAAISTLGEIPFLGVFTHEFGHFAGPLDHAQINGLIASDRTGETLPAGFTQSQAFDLYAPFTETLYPFIFNPPGGSVFLSSGGFRSSGFWVASLDLDTKNALSNLYPAPGYRATDPGSQNGAIEGRVLIRTSSGDFPISGVNVVARRISRGAYPPPAGAQAFPGFPGTQIQVDLDGVPGTPPDQDVTDPLATSSSAVTGLEFGTGAYRIDGLPPGQYSIEIQQINSRAVGGSGIGPLSEQLPILVPEFYNGSRESGDSSDIPGDFQPILVTPGRVNSGIDIILNGFSSAAVTLADEREPNDKTKKAQRLDLPAEISGSAAFNDPSVLRLTGFPDGSSDQIEDIYKFTLTAPKVVYILLRPVGGTASSDLDLYLFDSSLGKKRVAFNSSTIIAFSAGETATEAIGIELASGDYFIGVSAFDGTSVGYRLAVLTSQ